MSEEELLRHNLDLESFGKLSVENLSTCEVYGLSGNCGQKCPNFRDKTCEVYTETLERLLDQKDKAIDECIELLEYYYIGNMKYKDSQGAFKRLLEKLKQAKGSD